MLESSLELKGSSFTLSVLHIKSHDLNQITSELDEKLAQAPQFFLGAPLVLNLSAITDQHFELAELKQLLTKRKLVIVGVTAANNLLASKAKDIGLGIIKSGKPLEMPKVPRKTQIVTKNIRSGQQVYAKDSDLIIIGAVSNGAEVIADGSIHIYGSLRGKAMAGASGDQHSVIIAKSMQAELVSIAGQYWLSDNLLQQSDDKANCIRLNKESLIAESLAI
ncbi:MAG: septum site-determining protein MinC [Parashewanella sp.]